MSCMIDVIILVSGSTVANKVQGNFIFPMEVITQESFQMIKLKEKEDCCIRMVTVIEVIGKMTRHMDTASMFR